jgi:hypothetical protein
MAAAMPATMTAVAALRSIGMRVARSRLKAISFPGSPGSDAATTVSR